MAIKIQAAVFKEKIRDGKGIVDETISVEGKVVINKGEFKVDYFSFKGVKFNQGLVFDSTGDIGIGLKLINCSGRALFMSHCRVTNLSDDFDFPSGAGLILENCNFKIVQILQNPAFDRGIIIKYNSQIGRLDIENSNFLRDSILIVDSEVLEICTFINIESKLGIRLHNAKVNCKISSFNLSGDFLITSSTVTGDVHIENLTGNLTFNNSIFEDAIYVNNVKTDQFTSSGDHFKKGLDLVVSKDDYSGHLNKIFIQNTITGEGLIFEGSNQVVNEISIPASNILTGVFKFSNFKHASLNLSGLNSNANLIFKNTLFRKLVIEDFLNKAGLSFSNCSATTSNSELSITDSDLGSAVLLSFDFESFNDIRIQSSLFHDIELINPKLFRHSQLVDEEQDSGKLYAKKREVFRQLRHAVTKQGNTILATDLKSIELKLFRKEKEGEKLDKDKIMLWLISSNDMGLNWVKPIWLLALITLPFYIFTVAAYSDTLIWYNPIDFCSIHWGNTWATYREYSIYFWSMFNPVRNIKDLMEPHPGQFSGWVYFWDGLHRIVLAFFIFQIVSAFRKHLK